jgi:KDO2-lipid IV(A) lauroyltransferase
MNVMNPAAHSWIPDHLAALAYHTGSTAVQIVPESFARAVGRACGLVCWALQRERRRIVHQNYANVRRDIRDRCSASWTRQTFTNFGESVVDTLRLAHLDRSDLLRRVEIEDERVLTTIEPGGGAVLLTAHTANWEWAGAAMAVRGLPVRAVVRRHSPGVERFFSGLRSRFGVRTEVHLRNKGGEGGGGLLAIFADRHGEHSANRSLSSSTRCAAALAARRQWYLIPTWTERSSGGGYRVRFGPRLRPGRDRAERTACARVAEAYLLTQLRRCPGHWFAFESLPSPS